MKIKSNEFEGTADVYGIYWAEYNGKNQRFHLIIPEKGYPGFIAIPEDECEVTDSNILDFVLTKDTGKKDAFIHTELQDKELLERLIDHDADAMALFLSKIGVN